MPTNSEPVREQSAKNVPKTGIAAAKLLHVTPYLAALGLIGGMVTLGFGSPLAGPLFLGGGVMTAITVGLVLYVIFLIRVVYGVPFRFE